MKEKLHAKIKHLKEIISDYVQKNTHDLSLYCSCDQSSQNILQLKLLLELDKSDDPVTDSLLDCPEILGLINDTRVLELLTCSGGVGEGSWVRALELLRALHRIDPGLQDRSQRHPLNLRLAVAVALTFSKPIISHAYRHANKELDPVARYQTFAHLHALKPSPLFGIFQDLTSWHLRYVVGSWVEDEELEWARCNTAPRFKNPEAIGKATHSMVKYRAHNEEGESIHSGAAFYKHRPQTLELLQQEGGVCGAVSKFGAALCQAHGVPAMPVGQPGHCALTWYTGTEWLLGNKIRGWRQTRYHRGMQLQWGRPAQFHLLMDQALEHGGFLMSEKQRLVATFLPPPQQFHFLFLGVIPSCPYNYSAWRDMLDLAEKHRLYAGSQCNVVNVAQGKPVKANSNHKRAVHVTSATAGGDRAWWTKQSTAWVEIDLQGGYSVDHIRVQWWGYSKADRFVIYAISGSGDAIPMRTEVDQIAEESDEEDENCNTWITIPGWLFGTEKVRIELFDGHLDPWKNKRYFGIRQVQVYSAQELEINDDVSLPKGWADKALTEEISIQLKKEAVTCVVSEHRPVKVSSTKEQAQYITDELEGVWWTEKETAWIEIDLQRTCHVELIKIHWWGRSKADRFMVYAVSPDGDQILVGTERDQMTEPDEKGGKKKNMNQWIRLPGWGTGTNKVRVELFDGNLDPRKQSRLFGIRQIKVMGREMVVEKNLAAGGLQDVVTSLKSKEFQNLTDYIPKILGIFQELALFKGSTAESACNGVGPKEIAGFLEKLDGKTITASADGVGATSIFGGPQRGSHSGHHSAHGSGTGSWKPGSNRAWLEIELERVCLMRSVGVVWDGEEGRVTVQTENGQFDSLDNINLVDRKIRLCFSGQKIAVKQIQIIGQEFNTRAVLRERIKRLLENNNFIASRLIEEYLG